MIQNKHTASGFVIRDSSGYPFIAGSKNLISSNVLVVEALSLPDGLIQASSAGFKKIRVEGDSKIMINCINSDYSTPWRIKSIIADIRSFSSYFEVIIFKYIFKEANFATDRLANMGHKISSSYSWTRNLSHSMFNESILIT